MSRWVISLGRQKLNKLKILYAHMKCLTRLENAENKKTPLWVVGPKPKFQINLNLPNI